MSFRTKRSIHFLLSEDSWLVDVLEGLEEPLRCWNSAAFIGLVLYLGSDSIVCGILQEDKNPLS